MKPGKFLIFDAGPIISLTMNGMLDVLERLRLRFHGEFIITPQVRKEVVEKPLMIKKYELEALKVQNLIDKNVLTISSKFVSNNVLTKKTHEFMKKANSIFQADRQNIGIIQEGEASCLAFSELCKCENVIVADERTIRLLAESPENLGHLMEKKLHTKINADMKKINEFKNFRFIRSSELLYFAYKNNFLLLKKSKVLLDAVLYAVKFAGTSISSKEIAEMKEMAG